MKQASDALLFSFQSAQGFPPIIMGTQEMEIADIWTYLDNS